MTPEEIEAIIDAHKYPPVVEGETGINVVTLQIWLKMLGVYSGPTGGQLNEPTAQAVTAFRAKHMAAGPLSSLVVDKKTWEAMENLLKQRLPPDPYTLERLPFPRRRDYDSEEKYQKALYEGLKSFGFPIKPAAQRIEFRLTTNTDGVGRLSNLPPGEYNLTIESLNTAPTGSAEIRLVDDKGEPLVGTAILSGPGGEFSVRTQADGTASWDGLAPGEYILSLQNAQADLDNTAAGSMEIWLVDQAGDPLSATVLLSGDLGNEADVGRAVKLFKALARGVNLFEDAYGNNRFPSVVTDNLDESRFNENSWTSFSSTWGRFYGAPWMGVTFHSLNDVEPGRESGELNWGEFETILMLYEWGKAYLRESISEDELKERLRRPIAIRYIAKPLGGKIDQRADFSQIGTEASLHLPRKSEMIIDGIASGQSYGGIDYDSPEYSTSDLEKQITAFMSINTAFRVRCPDDDLIDQFQPQGHLPFETGLVKDQYTKARLMNASAEKMSGIVRPTWVSKGSIDNRHHIREKPDTQSPFVDEKKPCSEFDTPKVIFKKRGLGTEDNKSKDWYYVEYLEKPIAGWVHSSAKFSACIPGQNFIEDKDKYIQQGTYSFRKKITDLRRLSHLAEFPFDLLLQSDSNFEITLEMLKKTYPAKKLFMEKIKAPPNSWKRYYDYDKVLLMNHEVDIHHIWVGLDAMQEWVDEFITTDIFVIDNKSKFDFNSNQYIKYLKATDPDDTFWLRGNQPAEFGLVWPLGWNYTTATIAGDIGSAVADFLVGYAECYPNPIKEWDEKNMPKEALDFYYKTRVPDSDLLGDILPLAYPNAKRLHSKPKVTNGKAELKETLTISAFFKLLNHKNKGRSWWATAFRTFIICYSKRYQKNSQKVMLEEQDYRYLIWQVAQFAFIFALLRKVKGVGKQPWNLFLYAKPIAWYIKMYKISKMYAERKDLGYSPDLKDLENLAREEEDINIILNASKYYVNEKFKPWLKGWCEELGVS